MKMLNVLILNDYVSLKKNKDDTYEKLVPSKIKNTSVIISDYNYQLLQENEKVELELFNEMELLPLNMSPNQLKTYLEFGLELNLNDIKLILNDINRIT